MIQISREGFDALVEQAIAALPEQYAQWLEEVPVIVEDQPTAKQRADFGMDEFGDLLGSYHGVALTNRNSSDDLWMPDQIMLFRQPLMRMCRTREELAAEIKKTLLHELGHHAGLDENDLDDLGYG